MECLQYGTPYGKEVTMEKKQVKYPCRGCIYFNACGDSTRTEHCNGRKTKSEQKREERKER